MQDTITNHLQGLSGEMSRKAVRVPMKAIGDRMSSQPLTSAGLVIKSGGSALAKIGSSDFYASVQGVLVKIAASTDMPALSGSISAGAYNVFCFFVDQAGTTTSAMGIEGATLAAVKFPPFPENKALVGFLIVTYASAFTGGTTPLDTATTVYVSPLGAFDPSILTG